MKKSFFWITALFSGLMMQAQEQRDTIYISTNFGLMKAVFYEDVPRHKMLYEQRIRAGAFDGTLFFRVVRDFMIQGGSADSRKAKPGARIGQGSTQYLLMPEFRKAHFAKKGAIAAPRQGDHLNPMKKSDASQFFIVQGKIYTNGYLDTLEMAKNNPLKNAWWKEHYTPHKAEMDSLKKTNPRLFNTRLRSYRADMADYLASHPEALIFSEEQRHALTTIGGELSLDDEYTFFAEVVEGLDVIDKIASQETDRYDRPLKDVVIRSVRMSSPE